MDGRTDRQMDRRTDRQTAISYKDIYMIASEMKVKNHDEIGRRRRENRGKHESDLLLVIEEGWTYRPPDRQTD